MPQVFIGRQPIYTRDLQVAGYELLYRAHAASNEATITDGDAATSEVLISSLLDVGLPGLVGDQPAYINLTRRFILGEHPLPQHGGKLVLEILEDIAFDPEVLAGIRRLRARGYTIALDDFRFGPDSAAALELAHIIKLDVLALDFQELEDTVRRLRPYGVRLLAEKVESHAMYQRCLAMGFDYFQGYFFCRPNLIQVPVRVSRRGVILALLAALQNPEVPVEELEQHIVQDAPLTLRLLRYINSAGLGIGRNVTSIRQALILVGSQTIRNWASLILLARVDDKPVELSRIALVRARMCELLATARGSAQADSAFTVGLLSLLGALLDRDPAELLAELPLRPEVTAALMTGEGELGDLLRQVLEYERGDWEQLLARNIDPDTYRRCYLDAVRWADDSFQWLALADRDTSLGSA